VAAPSPSILAPLLAVNFVGLWFLVCGILAELSGWPTLARRFPGGPRPRERRLRRQVLTFGLVSENGVTNLIVSPQGLYLFSNPLFRFRRRPILVPWSQVKEAGERGRLWWRASVFDLGGVASIGVKRRACEAIMPFVTAHTPPAA